MEFLRKRMRPAGIAIMVVATIAFFVGGVYFRGLRTWFIVGWAIIFGVGKVLKDGTLRQMDGAGKQLN